MRRLLGIAMLGAWLLGGIWGNAAEQGDETTSPRLDVDVWGGMRENGKKFKGALIVNGGTQTATLNIIAKNAFITDVMTKSVEKVIWMVNGVRKNITPKWTPEINNASLSKVTQTATFIQVPDGGYKQITSGKVKSTEDKEKGNIDFVFDSSIDAMDIILEPIYACVADGNCPINPSVIVCGEHATFRCKVNNPTNGLNVDQSKNNYDGIKIEWSSLNKNVEIVSDKTKEEITVKAKNPGKFTLKITAVIKNKELHISPKISGEVREKWKVIPLYITAIGEWDKDKECFIPCNANLKDPAYLDNVIAIANGIYSQVGIRFVKGKFLKKTAKDGESSKNVVPNYGLLYKNNSKKNKVVFSSDNIICYLLDNKYSKCKSERKCRELTSLWSNTSRCINDGGFEIYYVNIAKKGSVGLFLSDENVTQRGIIISENANITTLAHELGHALGLDDIQVRNKDSDINELDLPGTKKEWCVNDWSNGCYQKKKGYHAQLISRLLMNNNADDRAMRTDIPYGKVYGYEPNYKIKCNQNVGFNSLQINNTKYH